MPNLSSGGEYELQLEVVRNNFSVPGVESAENRIQVLAEDMTGQWLAVALSQQGIWPTQRADTC